MANPFAVLNILFSVGKIALSHGRTKEVDGMLQHSIPCLRVVNTVEMLLTGFSKGCKHPSLFCFLWKLCMQMFYF